MTQMPLVDDSKPTQELKDIEKRINSKTFDLSYDELRSYNFFLTTSDNPFNPFENFRSWLAFDERKKYHSSGLLARIAKVTTELGEIQEKLSIVQGMHDIIRMNASGMHKIVVQRAEPDVSDDTMTDDA